MAGKQSMKIKHINNQSGKISKVLLILAAVVLVAIVIIFLVTRIVASRKSQDSNQNGTTTPTTQEPPKPVYEAQLEDIRFLLLTSLDLGNVLKAKSTYQRDFTTTEKFIEVVIGAQNKGKNNTEPYSWDMGNIVDSDGRNFIPITNQAYEWLPRPDLCGALLKPEFEPIPCVRIYEVSKESAGLKVEVKITGPKKQSTLLDLTFVR